MGPMVSQMFEAHLSNFGWTQVDVQWPFFSLSAASLFSELWDWFTW